MPIPLEAPPPNQAALVGPGKKAETKRAEER